MEEKLVDMKISGSGNINGGRYNEVKISGAAKVEGDIECHSYKCSGSSFTNGSVKAHMVGISGSTKLSGNINADEITVSGSLHILGDADTKKMKISGGSDIGGSLHAEEVQISGTVFMNGDCEAENFNVRGEFKIGGLLNAGNIDVEMCGSCRVKDIGGENIKVKLGRRRLFTKMLNFFANGGRLEAGTIEGDDIFLENTTAKIVRGNNVVIGDNCDIEVIEYRNKVNIDSTSKTICKKID
ncbi:cell shape determination protein CcmA [Clostridium fermenticellae]|uniref:Cell shape determination protein CcmA n=1 Tax=Clostridium fermenticellae TaxID=2068654 RepID=A0A386H3A6_9CLOT|nr:polymer-forming cytoskeletal protein [Clostridium fermenticellae]AYD40191.1 cell shape determination protein CcmA [Clostridium fermenticellae]